MRLDGVEVKVSLDRDQTAEAVRVLGLADVPPWDVYFVEDVTTGLCSRMPLQDEHLIMRARRKTTDRDDVTVKLRPGRRSQLTGRWLARTKTTDGGLESDFKVEADWAGDRRLLSVSFTAERPNGLVAAAAAGERDVRDLFTRDQKRLIDRCVGAPVNLDVLTVLPPVSAMRWPGFRVTQAGHPALDVRAERWTVLDMDFLELSIAVKARAARAAQAALIAFVEHHGLKPAEGEAKTSQVLQRLVAEAAC